MNPTTTKTTTPKEDNPNHHPWFRICVVGGGPAGAAVALGLRRQGHEVHLYEAYPHPLDYDERANNNNINNHNLLSSSKAAYVIALSQRGQNGLERATGIRSRDVTGGIRSMNMVRHHSSSRSSSLKLIQRNAPALLVPRQSLTAHILQQAKQAGVQLHFQHRLVSIDFERRVASFATTGGGTKQQQSYDLLIGADGSKSLVRTLLHCHEDSKNAPNFAVTRLEEDSMEYQVAVLSETRLNPNSLPDDTVHVWNSKPYNAIGLAFPIIEKRSTLFALVFPKGKLHEFKTTGYQDPLRRLLPDLTPHQRDTLAEQLARGIPAHGGTCVWCSSLGSPQAGVVLVGDAAHGMWPSLGQGANCALETAAVFCETVQDVSRALGGSSSSAPVTAAAAAEWSRQVVTEFHQRRHADAQAAVDLTYGGIGARQSRGRDIAPLAYKMQVAGMMMLHKLTMGFVPMPALLRIMSGDTLSYSNARMYHFYYEKLICMAGLAILTAPVLWWRRKASS